VTRNIGSCLLFYVKWPEPGKVKTRLSKHLGGDVAVELYRCFVRDMLNAIRKTELQLIICYSPSESETQFRDWLGEDYTYVPQRNGDLGDRLHHSFLEAFSSGFEEVCVVGSDVPTLPSRILHEAFQSLRESDSVLGPSGDGGYYLIGFRAKSYIPEVFQSIPWSTSLVFAATHKILIQRGNSVAILEEVSDIDTSDDLLSWFRRTQEQPEVGGITWQCCKAMARSQKLFKGLIDADLP